MFENKVPAEQVLEENRTTALLAAIHDFKVQVETRGIETVMNAMDEDTYWRMFRFFTRHPGRS